MAVIIVFVALAATQLALESVQANLLWCQPEGASFQRRALSPRLDGRRL
jgi:hypothetical protein